MVISRMGNGRADDYGMGASTIPVKERADDRVRHMRQRGPQVEGSCQHTPFGRHMHQAPQRESPGRHLFLENSEDPFHQRGAPFQSRLRPAGRHPFPMIPQDHVVGSHSQGAALGPVLGTHTEGGTGAANFRRAQVETHICLFAPHVAGKGQPLTLRASVTVILLRRRRNGPYDTDVPPPWGGSPGSPPVCGPDHTPPGWFLSNSRHRPASARPLRR